MQKNLCRTRTNKDFSFHSFRALIDSLESSINKLSWRIFDGNWAGYYEAGSSYNSESLQHKRQLVTGFIDKINPKIVWDLGANTGLFSRIASDRGIPTISFDLDPVCVERNYLTAVARHETRLFPLLLDLTNPSPSVGWRNNERMSIFNRGPADTVLALALIHHLAISNNLPFKSLAEFFKEICRWLIIEFVPKNDPMVQKLLSAREDIFPNYTEKDFESEFAKFFVIQNSVKIKSSERTLYLMQRKQTLP